MGIGEFLEWQDAAQHNAIDDDDGATLPGSSQGPDRVVRHPQNALVFPWNGQEGDKFGYTVEETYMPYKLKMISM